MTTTLVSPQVVTERPPPRRRRGRRPRQGSARLAWARRWVSPTAILLAWQVLSSTGTLPEDILASPLQILSTAAELLADGTLQSATVTSITRVVSGFLIGALAGLILATVAGLSRVGEDAVDPPMQMLRTLPHFGLIPLFIVWMGIGETPKIALIAMGVAFPLYLNTFAGIRSVDRKLLEAAHTLNLTHRQRLRHVVIPGALPQALVGLRQSLGVAWLSLIVAETVSADAGLGYLINDAREFLKTDVIVVGLAVYSLLGLLTDSLVRIIERKALAWRA
jgi:sulfonate transport system permease protein